MRNQAYVLPKEKREALESLRLPLAAYQFVDGKVLTLLVSEGMCTFYGKTREESTNGFNNDMFSEVHPDDREGLAKLGLRYATQEGPYDIIYRSRVPGKETYRFIHAVSKFHGMEDGSRVAITMYSDVTEGLEKHIANSEELGKPILRFIDENMGPLAIVNRKTKELYYYNKAMVEMLKPTVH